MSTAPSRLDGVEIIREFAQLVADLFPEQSVYDLLAEACNLESEAEIRAWGDRER